MIELNIRVSFIYHNTFRIGTIEKIERKGAENNHLVTIRHDEGTNKKLYSSYYVNKMTDLKIGV